MWLATKTNQFTLTNPRLLVIRETGAIEQRSERPLRVLPDGRRLGVVLGGMVRSVQASECGRWAVLFEIQPECWPVSLCPLASIEDLARLPRPTEAELVEALDQAGVDLGQLVIAAAHRLRGKAILAA